MEIDFDQRVQRSLADKEKAENDLKSNLEHSLKVLNLKADDDDAKKRYIDELKEEVEDMSVEMNHLRAAHAKELNEIEDSLKTEYEEKIKRMQEERAQEEMRLKQAVADNISEDTLNHHLKMERDRLERELDREVRQKHDREKEKQK